MQSVAISGPFGELAAAAAGGERSEGDIDHLRPPMSRKMGHRRMEDCDGHNWETFADGFPCSFRFDDRKRAVRMNKRNGQ